MTRTARGRRGNDGATKRARANERPTDKPSRMKGVSSGRERSKSAWHSFLHDRSVRSRVAALVLVPLLGTLVLGTLFFRGALDDASSASRVESLAEVGLSAVDALSAVQNERDVTGLFEGGGTGAGAVSDARAATDEALADLKEQLDERRDDDLGSSFEGAIIAFDRETERLEGYRSQRDAQNPPFDQGGTNGYHRFAEALQRIITASGSVADDPLLTRRINSLADIAQAVESASMERGIVAFFIEPGEQPTPANRDQATILQGEQDLLLTGRFISGFGFTDQARIYSNQIFVGNREIATARSDISNGVAARTTKEEWYSAATNRIDSLRDIEQETAERVLTRASSETDSARLTAGLSALAVLLVLGLTVYLTIVVARSIIGPLRRLRASALETAQTHLPALVDRVQRDGPAAARDTEQAVRAEGRDEIGQVATAFNDVHSTAVTVAAEQALLRQNLDTIVVNLSRRTQSLVDRQLGEIEGLEQRERDPDQLSTLFRIDHMATRVRRHAESLLVLAGVEEMRKHSGAAGVLDVVRTAVGEVEQYPRVKFGVMPTDLVAAGAVDDIAHLLAELIDNATEFSAPATPVRVTSQPLLGGGLRLQVTDSGLGIPEAQLAELNERLRNAGDIDVAASRTLGLYVVARLAAKHGVQVRLEAVPEGGTAAQVDLPAHLILSPLDTNEGLAPVTAETEVDDAPSAVSTDHGFGSLDGVNGETPAVSPLTATGLPRRAAHERQDTDTSFPAYDSGQPGEGDRPTWPAVHPTSPDSAPTGPQPVNARSDQPLASPSESVRSIYDDAPDQASEPAPADQSTWRSPAASHQSGDNGLAGSGTRPGATRPPAEPAARPSLRAPEPELPESDSPIFDSVASAWFSKSTTARDWSSPADEGWRKAAEALRSAEEAASARRSQRDTEPIPDATRPPAAPSRPEAPPRAPEPVAEQSQPTINASGLPVRRRGASLVPGSIGAQPEAEQPKRPAAQSKDAETVASTLSSLQRGVGRGREETGGWVPKRPGDPERSNK